LMVEDCCFPKIAAANSCRKLPIFRRNMLHFYGRRSLKKDESGSSEVLEPI
jgi:hypothetical protein